MSSVSEFFRRVLAAAAGVEAVDLGVAAVMLYAFLVEFFVRLVNLQVPNWFGNLSIVNALLLGVLLAFRNKEAYERWWEARKQWGQLINDARNFALKAKSLCGVSQEERLRAAAILYRFAIVLKQHLCDRSHGIPTPTHRPVAVAAECFDLLRDWRSSAPISEIDLLLFDAHAKGMMDVCGVCERIQSTPVPLSYRSLLRHGTILYLSSAPWFMAAEIGYWSIAFVGLISYFLLGTELTAESVEDPFGREGDDLELARFCETVRSSVNEILDANIPPP